MGAAQVALDSALQQRRLQRLRHRTARPGDAALRRLGILKEASPRHADILLCTGPVTRQSRDRLLRIYQQMPAPKWVVSMGSCSCSGGVFQGGHNILGGIDQVLPVDMYIFGCPCRPEAIIDGLAHLLEKIK